MQHVWNMNVYEFNISLKMFLHSHYCYYFIVTPLQKHVLFSEIMPPCTDPTNC